MDRIPHQEKDLKENQQFDELLNDLEKNGVLTTQECTIIVSKKLI